MAASTIDRCKGVATVICRLGSEVAEAEPASEFLLSIVSLATPIAGYLLQAVSRSRRTRRPAPGN